MRRTRSRNIKLLAIFQKGRTSNEVSWKTGKLLVAFLIRSFWKSDHTKQTVVETKRMQKKTMRIAKWPLFIRHTKTSIWFLISCSESKRLWTVHLTYLYCSQRTKTSIWNANMKLLPIELMLVTQSRHVHFSITHHRFLQPLEKALALKNSITLNH